SHPQYELFDDDDNRRSQVEERAHRPIPLYPATSAVESGQFRELVERVVADLGPVPDLLSDAVRAGAGLLDARPALSQVHRPETKAEVHPAVRTLRMHEALMLQTALLQQRAAVRSLTATPRPAGAGGLLERFDAALPYTLTPDQEAVGAQIMSDLTGQS